jgi:hypothetical protein
MSRTVQYTHVPETNFFAALTYPCQRLGGNGIIMTFLKSHSISWHGFPREFTVMTIRN